MTTETIAGITYSKPTASLLHASPLVNAEIAGRTAYNSFSSSEHKQVQDFDGAPVEDIESSELMTQLCHVYFHDSVVEHINLTYHLTTSRGVLQELVRHRIASYTVRSTRYTMSSVINAFIATGVANSKYNSFYDLIKDLDLFVTTSDRYNNVEIAGIWDKLRFQLSQLGKDKFLELALSKDNLNTYTTYEDILPWELYKHLESGKKKRNVGDAFKHIVTDNWKVDMVVTMNLRTLKNYFTLRDSGAAYFQIQHLAQAMKSVTPRKYLDLIVKSS